MVIQLNGLVGVVARVLLALTIGIRFFADDDCAVGQRCALVVIGDGCIHQIADVLKNGKWVCGYLSSFQHPAFTHSAEALTASTDSTSDLVGEDSVGQQRGCTVTRAARARAKQILRHTKRSPLNPCTPSPSLAV